MEELKTLVHDLHKVKQLAKTSYSVELHNQLIELIQEYEITVEDVRSLKVAWRN